MRSFVAAVVVSSVIGWSGPSLWAKDSAPLISPTAPAAVPHAPGAVGDATADDVLDALDRRGRELKAFDAKVTLTETDESTQLASTRTGRAWFQKKSADDARLRVLLEKRVEPRKVLDEKIEYLLDNGWLNDRDYQKRIEVRRQVLRPGERVNLLKLGEGPFPLPIGQKKEDVKKLFDVKRLKPAKDDPPGTTHVLLKPIKGTQFARRFSAIDVWVDGRTDMPVRIDTLDAKEVTTRTTKLDDVRINPDLGDGDFALEKIPQDKWNIHDEPFHE